jgi:hypothetical protein
VLAAALVAVGVAACGGSGASRPDAAKLLSQSFGGSSAKVHSGDISITLNANLGGIALLAGKPLSVQAAGPFSESAGQFTAFDLSATVSFGGSAIPLGLLSTGKALYLQFGGTNYAMPASIDSALQQAMASSASGGGSSGALSALGIDPSSWLSDPTDVGTATVGGVATDHITARVDVAKLVGDLQKALASSSSASGSSTGATGAALGQLASAISSANVDIFTGTSDHIVRELRLALSFTVPQADRSSLDGLSGGSFKLDLTLTNLNAPETIKPPSSSQPLSGLLGGAGLSSL